MDYKKYENKLPWGLTEEQEEVWKSYIKKEEETFVGTKAQIESHFSNLKLQRDVESKEGKKKYSEETARLEELFWIDALEELDIDPNHPKIDILKRIAWDRGHSEGFYQIFNELSYLKELL